MKKFEDLSTTDFNSLEESDKEKIRHAMSLILLSQLRSSKYMQSAPVKLNDVLEHVSTHFNLFRGCIALGPNQPETFETLVTIEHEHWNRVFENLQAARLVRLDNGIVCRTSMGTWHLQEIREGWSWFMDSYISSNGLYVDFGRD